jgi:site-specific DNA-methyltransferase (adenine-specific)
LRPYYDRDGITIYHGDSTEILPHLTGLDCCVTDPPYGLSFMGKAWDYDVPTVALWSAVLAALKPGAHLLAFAGTRTQHRMAVNIEDAGFEIRDMIAWVYGGGFPKSHNIGQGWGTALKPALEPITMARKPLAGTVADNMRKHGTGAINVDGCRVASADAPAGRTRHGGGIVGNGTSYELPDYKAEMPAGRWPANLIHDGSEEVTDLFPGEGEGSAARFFYCAKANKADRGEGNDHPTVKPSALMQYLCRLVCPPGGVVLDPFAGSGSTLLAARALGMRAVGIEREEKYCRIIAQRLGGAPPAVRPEDF